MNCRWGNSPPSRKLRTQTPTAERRLIPHSSATRCSTVSDTATSFACARVYVSVHGACHPWPLYRRETQDYTVRFGTVPPNVNSRLFFAPVDARVKEVRHDVRRASERDNIIRLAALCGSRLGGPRVRGRVLRLASDIEVRDVRSHHNRS